MVRNLFRDGQRTIFWIGCACIGTYIAYRYWRKRELRWIDEGFEEVSKIDDNHEKRVLMLGLDHAGKTSIVQQVCVANNDALFYKVPPEPTKNSTPYRITYGSFHYNIWDIGGADANRKYWCAFLQDTDLLIFVVDSSDTSKLPLAVATFKELLGDSRIDAVPILVIANKQDCADAMEPEKVKEALDLLSVNHHKHKVEVIGCQTRPLPDLPPDRLVHTTYHKSIDVVRKKIFSMTA